MPTDPMTPRRFPSPWSIEETYTCFTVLDASGQKLAYFYFEKEPGRRSAAKLLSRDEAFLLAVNFAKLPTVPRQILKDIPRPPNSPVATIEPRRIAANIAKLPNLLKGPH